VIKRSMQILSFLVAGIIIASSLSTGIFSASAQGDLPVPSEKQITDSTLSGPVFLDSYWTNVDASSTTTTTSTRKEVGPGDGASTLAVVLVNRGYSEITQITGHLTLPDGFTANGRYTSANTADTTFDTVVGAGSTFTLYFDVNVSDKARVGQYIANLNIEYSRVLELGTLRNNSVDVPVLLTGKVILDSVTLTHNLVPGVTNNVDLEIRNSGSAPATGVVITIMGINTNNGNSNSANSDNSSTSSSFSSQGQIINTGSRTFSIGTIKPNSNANITASIFPNNSAGGSTANIQLDISYNDAYGNAKSFSPTVGLVILPSAASVISVNVVSPTDNNTDNRIVAGKVDDLILKFENKGMSQISNAIISISSTSDSIKILGDSKWTVDAIGAKSQVLLPTRIFAAPSLIGTPASFDISIGYLLNGESKAEQYILGTYVDGDISLRMYDLAINYVGNTPTLVGNLLNEGNTAAFFTTIELMQQPTADSGNSTRRHFDSQAPSQFGQQTLFQNSSSMPPPQYLGDLTANSPLPFSIPLNSFRGFQTGTFPVTIKVTYKDGLRNPHEFISSQNVALAPPTTQFSSGQDFRNRSQGMGMFMLIIIAAVVAAAAIATVFIVRRRKKLKTRQLQSQNDSSGNGQENIEDILANPSGAAKVDQQSDSLHVKKE